MLPTGFLPAICRIITPGRRLVALLILLLLTSVPASAGWRVVPIRLDFDQRTKSGVVTLSNDGEQSMTFAIEAGEWTQDENGQDRYEPTEDLVFFPRQLTVEPGKERIIRTGIRVPAGPREKAYRLFIREAGSPAAKAEGAAVAIAIKFGLPIFARPAKDEITGELLTAAPGGGLFQATAVNRGNAHFRIGTVTFTGTTGSGEQVYSQVVNGWYLLPGASRGHEVQVPADTCARLKTLNVQLHADRLYLDKTIDVDPAMCTPR